MILTCPECTARYTVKDDAFGTSGRRVRCAKCGHSWFQDPPEGTAAEPQDVETAPQPEPDPTPAPEAAGEEPADVQPEADEAAETAPALPAAEPARPTAPSRRGAIIGWAVLAVVVLAIVSLAVALRQQIATAWPQSASLYAAIGLPVNTSGIAFADVRYVRQSEDNQNVLAVSGTLLNITAHRAIVPPVRVILSGADGHELYRWEFRPLAHILGPGQSASFKTRLSSPPDAARHLTLEFVNTRDE